jgi:hypothetical protein
MFERYTESARRLIFFARKEADQAGSPFVETEHFALALLNEEKNLIRRLLPDSVEAFQSTLRETLASNTSTRGRVDSPLSHSLKRVLAYGAEAAETLRDPQIRSAHLLLGLLKEKDCPAARILQRYGVSQETVLQEIAAMEIPRPRNTRETLSALVASLPEDAIDRAHAALTHLQVPRAVRRQVPERITELREEMHQKFLRSIPPGQGMVGGSGGAWRTDAQGKLQNGSFSSGRIEDGAHVTETHRFFEGNEIIIIERARMRQDEKLLSYSQEIHGPNRQHRFEIDFNIG